MPSWLKCATGFIGRVGMGVLIGRGPSVRQVQWCIELSTVLTGRTGHAQGIVRVCRLLRTRHGALRGLVRLLVRRRGDRTPHFLQSSQT